MVSMPLKGVEYIAYLSFFLCISELEPWWHLLVCLYADAWTITPETIACPSHVVTFKCLNGHSGSGLLPCEHLDRTHRIQLWFTTYFAFVTLACTSGLEFLVCTLCCLLPVPNSREVQHTR